MFIKPDCISAYILDVQSSEPQYLLIRRCGPYLNGTWQMVSGGIEEGEKAYETAKREIFEETGMNPIQLYSADAVESFYFMSQDRMIMVPVFVAYGSMKNEVILSSKEHDAFEWLTYDGALERLVWAEQKRVFKHIHENFGLKRPNPLLLIT